MSLSAPQRYWKNRLTAVSQPWPKALLQASVVESNNWFLVIQPFTLINVSPFFNYPFPPPPSYTLVIAQQNFNAGEPFSIIGYPPLSTLDLTYFNCGLTIKYIVNGIISRYILYDQDAVLQTKTNFPFYQNQTLPAKITFELWYLGLQSEIPNAVALLGFPITLQLSILNVPTLQPNDTLPTGGVPIPQSQVPTDSEIDPYTGAFTFASNGPFPIPPFDQRTVYSN